MTDVVWRGTACVLTVHFENGFFLDEQASSQQLWQYPFERLRFSSDDAQRRLILDFGGQDGEHVSILDIKKKVFFLFFREQFMASLIALKRSL